MNVTVPERPRPADNDQLVGHADAERQLADAFHSETLAHAWMITGPKGIGKATLTYRFARYVLKHSGNNGGDGSLFADTGEPEAGSLFGDDGLAPGEGVSEEGGLYVSPGDPVFRRIAAGGHADLSVIERALKSDKGTDRYTVIRIDDVRSIGGFLHMTPAEGGWRVVIVDAADDMNLNAQNGLLKVLEEPPARSLILLVCNAPGRLLPTIRSRCRTLALRALEDAEVERLIGIYAPDVPTNDARDYAAMASGSIGQALALIDADGLDIYRNIKNLFDGLPNLDVPKLHDFAGGIARKNADAAYGIATSLILGSIRSHIRESALKTPGPRVDRWLEVWENSARLMERADSVNLDRKQVIVGIFHAAADAAA